MHLSKISSGLEDRNIDLSLSLVQLNIKLYVKLYPDLIFHKICVDDLMFPILIVLKRRNYS